MKKYFIIILFLGVFLSGCQVDSTPIYYRSFQDQRFLKIDENTYRYENQYIYVTDPDKDLQIITTRFSNVIIEVETSKQAKIIYPDGCYAICSNTGCAIFDVFSHNHSYIDYYEISLEQTDNSAAEMVDYRKLMIPPLILVVIMAFFCGIFVFKPSYVSRFTIFWNKIIPMHKEPYEPSELNITLQYIGFLFCFIAGVIGVIFILLSFF